MWGKQSRATKWYPAIVIVSVVVLCLGSAWLFSRVSSGIQQPPTELEPLSTPEAAPKPPTATQTVAPSPVPKPRSTAPANDNQALAKPDLAAISARQGALRVSNPTDYPIRVALLPKVAKAASPTGETANPSAYEPSAHWDFDPQEGGSKGLIVSLPDRALKIKPGDILVAFAQDGSRRYWGPYVVGATSQPIWNSKTEEWQLVLQP